ncbi:MAG: hypothetical protein KAT66_07490, partial [Candidatus Lokiarchaeota archaeon]|nr:hypothetical protein [Candidatus Lokiarchaeota archaeon]
IPSPETKITEFIQPQVQEYSSEAQLFKITPITQRSPIEIGLEQVKNSVQNYISEKSKTNKQITCANTIKAIKKLLKLAESEKTWDEDIWTTAIDLSKSICVRTTPKTIYFRS